MAAVATTTDFVVSEDVIEHVRVCVHKHLQRRQKRGVPATSMTLVDRIMLEFEDLFPDQFWSRVAAWYTLAMERTEPKCRGFMASDFFEIVAAHVRNDVHWEEIIGRPIDASIEERVRRDAYVSCTIGISDYTVDADSSGERSSNPKHQNW